MYIIYIYMYTVYIHIYIYIDMSAAVSFIGRKKKHVCPISIHIYTSMAQ